MQIFYKNIKSLTIPLLLVMSGCASVMMGSYQDIYIETKCGEKIVKAECSLSNEVGEWSVKTPGAIRLHKGYDELELNCKSDNFDLHRVKITSSGNIPLYGNVFVGGGLGAIVDFESRAGFDYPTKITFKVPSCAAPANAKLEERATSSTKETQNESAKSYAVKRGLVNTDGASSGTKSNLEESRGGDTLRPSESEFSRQNEKLDTESVKREPGKPKPVPYCKQLDMGIPGCALQ